MVIHQFECIFCGRTEDKTVNPEEDMSTCSICHNTSMRRFNWGSSSRNVFQEFKPFVCEELYDKPVEITSRRDLAKRCKEEGKSNAYLEGGYKRWALPKEI